MLEKIIKAKNELTEEHAAVQRLHCQGYLAIRSVRSLSSLLTSDSTPIVADLHEEIASLRRAINTKHNGPGHFSTILLMAGQPIDSYKGGVGLIFDASNLKIKDLCHIDARDDNGKIGDGVKVTKDYPTFHGWIRDKKPGNDGFIHDYPEAQLYCTLQSCKGIFSSINAHRFDTKSEAINANIHSYLTALATQKLIHKFLGINFSIYLYDVFSGCMLPVTRSPSAKVVKDYIEHLFLQSSHYFDLSVEEDGTTQKKLQRLSRRLEVVYENNELQVLLDRTKKAAVAKEAEDLVSSFNQIILNSYMPTSIVLLYCSNNPAEQAFSIQIPFNALDIPGTRERLNAMHKSCKISTATKNEESSCYTVNLKNDEVHRVKDYFMFDEPTSLRALSEKDKEEYRSPAFTQ
jgi:hypothetical protein